MLYLFLKSGGSEKSRFVKSTLGNESLLRFLGLLGEKHSLDVGQDTTLGNGHT